MVNVTDGKELEAWLKKQPHRTKIAFANRATMRVLPIVLRDPYFDQFPVTDRASNFLLFCFRSYLVSWVASTWPAPEINEDLAQTTTLAALVARSHASASAAARSASRAAAIAAAGAALTIHATRTTDFDAANAATTATTAAALALPTAETDTVIATRTDAEAFSTVDTIEGICTAKLWPEGDLPDIFYKAWYSFREKFLKGEWAFWIEWYQGMLDGQPMDWALQVQIALIPDEDWQKGAEHIAQVIEEIRARFDLTKKLEAAEQKIAELEASRRGRGGNNPPELIDDEASSVALSVVRKSVEGLKEETEADKPDPSRVQKFLETLRGFMAWIGKYTGKKADAFLQKFVESCGTAAGPVAIVALTGLGLEVAGVIESAEIWALILKKIGG